MTRELTDKESMTVTNMETKFSQLIERKNGDNNDRSIFMEVTLLIEASLWGACVEHSHHIL